MLQELKIENLAIIDELDINLSKGLTVLTGETGAGKSIILDGISMIIGDKASKDMLGKRKDRVSLEAIIKLNENQITKISDLGYDLEEELIITREFSQDMNKLKIDGKRYNLSSLKEIMSNVLDIVGQHDHQYLLNSSYHISLVDKFMEKEVDDIKKELKKYIYDIKKLEEEILEIENEKKDMELKKDLYNFSIKEIFKYNLKEDEEEILESEYKKLFNSGIIRDKLEIVDNILSNLDLSTINKELSKLSSYSEKLEEIYERFSNIYDEINELSNDISSELIDVNQDPNNLDKIVSRLNIIKNLKRKYGNSIEEILKYGENLKNKLELLEFSDEILENKKNKRQEILDKYYLEAEKLSNLRKEKAEILKSMVQNELQELNMLNVKFDIDFKKLDKISSNGLDMIKFLISTNKGEELKELSKIASGGEISRIMLALKIVFSKVDNISCLIFDEIDTGISGETVIKIAHKLKELSKKVQVICVTHSPQIAAKADTQFLIYKEIENANTNTKVKKLSKEERIREIARILSGDNITEASLNIATEMMK